MNGQQRGNVQNVNFTNLQIVECLYKLYTFIECNLIFNNVIKGKATVTQAKSVEGSGDCGRTLCIPTLWLKCKLVFIFTGVGIVNTIKWTSGLDKYFKENEMMDHSLLWQYFGSADGVYRVYPGKTTGYPAFCYQVTQCLVINITDLPCPL